MVDQASTEERREAAMKKMREALSEKAEELEEKDVEPS